MEDNEEKERSIERTIVAIVVIVFFGYVLWNWLLKPGADVLVAPSGQISLERAVTEEEQKAGLSGRETLEGDKGLLFVFDELSTKHCIWMKDMKFAIDVIWIDGDREVVSVRKNVTPDSYPASYCPDKPAQYVLEVSTGQMNSLGIKVGSTLEFNTDK